MPSVTPKLLAPCCALLAAAACARSPPELVLSGPTMGTTYTVKVAAAPPSVDPAIVRVAIDDVLEHADRSMSGYRADSEVARFNASASTQWYDVSPELAAVVQASLDISTASDGVFDITVAPLVAAWGFGPAGAPKVLPGDEQIAQIEPSVGYRKLHVRLDRPALRKDVAGLSIDLNGIAPGFAVDRLADRLQALQIENFMIDIGGEIRAQGHNARGEPWHIAVEQPVDTERTPYASVWLDGAAVSTSGEYRDYYDRDGHSYSHTIDPRTGHTLDRAPGSVVVVAPLAAQADGWATALNVLGPRDGIALATRLHLPVLFIERDGSEWRSQATPEFAQYGKKEATSD
ncbi:MAG TPA: FAD:protein FMN transferase [Steroidobacteraceae bacterium]|jgi:thiamine biosynthesis lipoprotein|nr:FAD:protein FMN transferase [Steroidobacteraceae bacterium]